MRKLNNQLLSDNAFWEGLPVRVQLPAKPRSGKPTGLVWGTGVMAQAMIADKQNHSHRVGGDNHFMAGVETYAADNVRRLGEHDNLALHLVFGADPTRYSVAVHNVIDPVLFLNGDQTSGNWNAYRTMARDPALHYATLNVPEGAYGVSVTGGRATPLNDDVRHDMSVRGSRRSHLGKWTEFALVRFNSKLPFAVVSCTNFSSNGDFTRASFHCMAEAWESTGDAPRGFADYISDPMRFRCPNVMIDRISVQPNDRVEGIKRELGIDGPTVVTEDAAYFVIHDVFPEGQRPFHHAVPGIYYEQEETGVRLWEAMKLRTLNAAHSITASTGILLGYVGDYNVAKAMNDGDIGKLVSMVFGIVVPLLESPSQKRPADFAAEVLWRVRNPNLPDDPRRIALNSSTKIEPRFTASLFKQLSTGTGDPKPLVYCVAAMLRYMCGIDDEGKTYTVADDPRKSTIEPLRQQVQFGNPKSAVAFRPLISDPSVMGRNLYEVGNIGLEVEGMLARMLEGPGAVRRLLREIVR